MVERYTYKKEKRAQHPIKEKLNRPTKRKKIPEPSIRSTKKKKETVLSYKKII